MDDSGCYAGTVLLVLLRYGGAGPLLVRSLLLWALDPPEIMSVCLILSVREKQNCVVLCWPK